MNPNADNESRGESFDFGAAEHQFEDVELPTLELGPAERQIARKIEHDFEVLEMGLRHTLSQIEALREIDFEDVMRRPDLVESACAFSEVAGELVHGLAPIAVAAIAARAEFNLDSTDDLSEAA